jgi:hypothetical protein
LIEKGGVRFSACLLPCVVPGLVRWAERRQAEVLRDGDALTGEELELAMQAGVRAPERIRIQVQEKIPMPDLWWIGQLARNSGLGFEPAGLSLGYAVVVRSWEGRNTWLVTHEFVHTAQYERLGGMSLYLSQYLRECLIHGYRDAPMEEEAVVLTGRIFGWNS